MEASSTSQHPTEGAGVSDLSENINEPAAFKPCWPSGIEAMTAYQIPCDDKGRSGGSWLRVIIANDGDVHVSMQDWEEVPKGEPSPCPSIRIRTHAGGGRSLRTRQALLWLAEAIRLDAKDQDPNAPKESS